MCCPVTMSDEWSNGLERQGAAFPKHARAELRSGRAGPSRPPRLRHSAEHGRSSKLSAANHLGPAVSSRILVPLVVTLASATVLAAPLQEVRPQIASPRAVQAMPVSSPAFDDLLAQYRRMNADAAVEAAASWSANELTRHALERARTADRRDMAALALLLTEAGISRHAFAQMVFREWSSLKGKAAWRVLPWPKGDAKAQQEFFLGPSKWATRDVLNLDDFEPFVRTAAQLIATLTKQSRAANDDTMLQFCREWYAFVLTSKGALGSELAKGPLWRAALVDFGDDAETLVMSAELVSRGPWFEFYWDVRRTPSPYSDDPGPVTQTLTTRPIINPGGVVVTSRGRFNRVQLKAEPMLRRALELKPEMFLVRLRLGRLIYRLDRLAESVPEFARVSVDAKAAGDIPTSFLASMLCGEAARELGRLDDAVAAFRKALETIPRTRSAQLALGAVLVDAGRPAEGWATLRQVIGEDGRSSEMAKDPWFMDRYPVQLGITAAVPDLKSALRAFVRKP